MICPQSCNWICSYENMNEHTKCPSQFTRVFVWMIQKQKIFILSWYEDKVVKPHTDTVFNRFTCNDVTPRSRHRELSRVFSSLQLQTWYTRVPTLQPLSSTWALRLQPRLNFRQSIFLWRQKSCSVRWTPDQEVNTPVDGEASNRTNVGIL